MALINKLSTALEKEARDLAKKAGISLEEAASQIIDREGQKVFGLTAKPAVDELPTDPSKFLGTSKEKDNRSLSEYLAASQKASSAAAPVSKEQALVPYTKGETALVPVGEVKPRTSSEIRLPSKLPREVEEKGTAAAPGSSLKESLSKTGNTYSEPVGPTYLGKEPEKAWTPTGTQIAVGSLLAGTGLAGPLGYSYNQYMFNQNKPAEGPRLTSEQVQQAQKNKGSQPDISFTPEARAAASGIKYSAAPPELNMAEVKAALDQKNLQKQPTSEIKNNATRAAAGLTVASSSISPSASPELVDSFKQQRDQAYDLYEKAKTRNEWLEVAQLMGQAFTQYAAAQAGMRSGRPMAGLQVPSIDYGARTEREARTLERTLRDIEGQEERQQRDIQRGREEERWKKEFGLKEKELRQSAEERKGRLSAEEKEEIKATDKNLREALKISREQEAAALSVANILASESNLTDKTLKKIEEKLPGLAAKAGISALDIQQLEKDATTEGRIWDTLDRDKRNKLIQERIINKTKAATNDILSKLKALESRQKGQAVTEAPTQQPKVTAAQLQEYAKQNSITPEQARAFLTGKGYAVD